MYTQNLECSLVICRMVCCYMFRDYDCYGAPGKIAAGRPAMMPNWEKDYNAGRLVLEQYDLPVFECPLHLEGGSIHSDGEG